jgi:hypothetical protein
MMKLAWFLITVSAGPFFPSVGAQYFPQLLGNFGFPVDSTQPGEDNEVNSQFPSFFPGPMGSPDLVDSTAQNPFTSSFPGLGSLRNNGNNAVPPDTAFQGFFTGGGMNLLDTSFSPFTGFNFGSFGAGDESGGADASIQPFTPSLGNLLIPGPNLPIGLGPDAGPVNPDCNPGTGVGCVIGDNGGGINCQQGGDRVFCSSVGRPFVDADGMTITSDASTCEVSAWAAAATAPDSSASLLLRDSNHFQNQELGSEWTRRAIGEHASIASFAVFTINLMSNQAPPDLIRDSLNAAMDELNHATTAFEMASLLTGQQIEPGALPPSKLTFDKNLTALALATAREGCIAETLSALELAIEVDRSADVDADTDDVSVMLMRKTKTIALEEGRHSVLAWRTIHWVCSTDSAACDIVKRQVFEKVELAGAGKGRSGSQADSVKIEEAWTRLFETLVSFVTIQEDATLAGAWSSTLDCASADTHEEEDEAGGLTGLLVKNIIRGVYCGVEESSTSPLSLNEE